MVAIASFYSFTKFISYLSRNGIGSGGGSGSGGRSGSGGGSGGGGGGGGGHRNKNGGGFTTLWNMQHQVTQL